jgi:hypothetical protein
MRCPLLPGATSAWTCCHDARYPERSSLDESIMATHHVLCIHGIGKHADDWVRTKDEGETHSFEDLARQAWERYPATKKKGAFDDRVRLHSIHYDDEINKIFANWEEQANKLKEGLALSPLLLDQAAWFTDAVDKASGAKNEADWRYTHLMDLLLFVASPSIQDRLVAYVGAQIAALVKEHHAAGPISVIAHSMGCAMAHKAIQALYNEEVETPMGRQSLKGDFKFEHVCMVANTSYALSRDRANHYKGMVRPSLTAGQGCCFSWINANHQLDPVGRFQRFDHRKDPSWLDPRIEGRGWHRDIVLSRISAKNIHALTHYFRDPALHIPFFELAFDARFSDAQRGAAVDDFIASTPEGKFKGLRAQFNLLDVSSADSFKDFIKSFKAFRDAIRLFG